MEAKRVKREIELTVRLKEDGVSIGAAMVWWFLGLVFILYTHSEGKPSLYDALIHYLMK